MFLSSTRCKQHTRSRITFEQSNIGTVAILQKGNRAIIHNLGWFQSSKSLRTIHFAPRCFLRYVTNKLSRTKTVFFSFLYFHDPNVANTRDKILLYIKYAQFTKKIKSKLKRDNAKCFATSCKEAVLGNSKQHHVRNRTKQKRREQSRTIFNSETVYSVFSAPMLSAVDAIFATSRPAAA